MSIFVNLLIMMAYKLPHRYFLIVLLSLPWSVIVSCDKQEYGCDGPDYNYISKNLYPLLFQEGSYWIYQNEVHKEIDSVFLVQREKSTISFNTGHGCSNIEEVYYLSYSSSIRGNYKDLYLGYVITRGGPDGGYIYLSSHEIGDKSLNARIDEIYDSLVIADQTYYNVVKMDVSIDKYINEEMNLYFADSTGIIRKEIRNGVNVIETFDLIESSVILMQNK